jgi:hypothetical protein
MLGQRDSGSLVYKLAADYHLPSCNNRSYSPPALTSDTTCMYTALYTNGDSTHTHPPADWHLVSSRELMQLPASLRLEESSSQH